MMTPSAPVISPLMPTRPQRIQTLDIAYTPDSDDAFNFLGWEHGHVTLQGFAPRFHRNHIAELNSAALHGEFDVVAVSSVAYPLLADQYWILSVGSSVGRGYGPVLVSKEVLSIEQLEGKRVGVASKGTTGGTLARMYCPRGTIFKELPYDRIAESILRDELDAGVMIHEELVHYPAMGLRRVEDLGGLWTKRTGLPLPVGLNLVKKSVGREDAVRIARACRDSLLWSLEHTQEAMDLVGGMGRSCAAQFVPMFSNDDTLCMPRDVRQGLAVLFDRLSALGWAPALSQIEVIDA